MSEREDDVEMSLHSRARYQSSRILDASAIAPRFLSSHECKSHPLVNHPHRSRPLDTARYMAQAARSIQRSSAAPKAVRTRRKRKRRPSPAKPAPFQAGLGGTEAFVLDLPRFPIHSSTATPSDHIFFFHPKSHTPTFTTADVETKTTEVSTRKPLL